MNDRLPNIHPGEILQEEFLLPLNVTQYALAQNTGVPHSRVTRIIKGQQRITPDTAVRLAAFFGNSARFWLGLQMDYDLAEIKNARPMTRKMRVTPLKNIKNRRRIFRKTSHDSLVQV